MCFRVRSNSSFLGGPFRCPSAWMWAVIQTLHAQWHRNKSIYFYFVSRLNWVFQVDGHLWRPRFLSSAGYAILRASIHLHSLGEVTPSLEGKGEKVEGTYHGTYPYNCHPLVRNGHLATWNSKMGSGMQFPTRQLCVGTEQSDGQLVVFSKKHFLISIL